MISDPVRVALRLLPGLCCVALLHATPAIAAPSSRDAEDGWLDVSDFLDTAYGFVPLLAPITEPAVGYGAVGALVFVDRQTPAEGQGYARPNMAIVGGAATENDTRGLFAGHLGNWNQGRLRTLVAVADAEINLEFFGLGGERYPGASALEYTVDARGGVAGGSYRIGATAFWAGLRYAYASTSVGLTGDLLNPPPGLSTGELDADLDLAALTPTLTFDTRDNFFTPTRGWYLDLSVPVFRENFGGDRNFEKATLAAMHYRPLTESLYFSTRAAVKASSDGTPFYLRPFVMLRGVQALRYQGEQAAEIEAELRWQFHPRLSVVGFGGAGIARREVLDAQHEETVTAGGAGLRYLLARKHGLHMGLDLAFGPDDPVIYLIFGSAWLRP